MTEIITNDNVTINETHADLHCGDIPDLEKMKEWNYYLGGVGTLVTASFGVLANFLSLYILSKGKAKAIFSSLLSCLCLADIAFLTSSLFLVPVALGCTGTTFFTLYSIFDCFSHVSLSGSVFFTVAITIERYKAVCLAHKYNYRNARIGHRRLVLRYVCPVLVLAIILNIPKVIVISPIGDILKNNYSFWHFVVLYQIFHPVTSTVIAPLLVLIFLNIKTFKIIPIPQNTDERSRKVARQREIAFVKICSLIVIVFIVCNLPRLAIGLFEISRIPIILECSKNNVFYFAPIEQWLADFVARYLAIINCSINFIIYCVVGSNFRKDLFTFWDRNRGQISIRSTTCNNIELVRSPEL